MTDVFISYKRQDRNKARALAETLAKRGYDVWWDIELLPGQRFADEINAVLNTAKVAIVLWTPEAVGSDWVKSEASVALNREILIPARLTEVDIPAPYNTLHTSDLTSWDGSVDAAVLNELLTGVAKLAGKPVMPESPLSNDDIEDTLARPKYEVEFWITVSNKKPQSIAEYKAYLDKYGKNASFATLAKIRIEELAAKKPERKRIGFVKTSMIVGVIVGITVGTIQVIDWVHYKQSPEPVPGSTTGREQSVMPTSGPNQRTMVVDRTADFHEKPTATLVASGGIRTSLVKYSSVILDTDSMLTWAKNIYAIGFTKDLFEKSDSSLVNEIKVIREKAATLELDGISGWRLATTQDIATLRKIDPSAVFLAFYTYRSGPTDVIGIYQNEKNSISLWGYQHANYLSDPIESHWIQGNNFGVWLVSDAGESLETAAGTPVYAYPEVQEEKRLEPIIIGRFMKTGDQITSTWNGITDGLIGNLESDDTRSVFEYSLKSVESGGFVRAELALSPNMTSGIGKAVISIYQGDGQITDGDWLPEGLESTNDLDTISWSAEQNSRVELPAHILRNLYNTEGIVGLHVRYVGKGNIHFKPPALIVTYVKKANLLTQYLVERVVSATKIAKTATAALNVEKVNQKTLLDAVRTADAGSKADPIQLDSSADFLRGINQKILLTLLEKLKNAHNNFLGKLENSNDPHAWRQALEEYKKTACTVLEIQKNLDGGRLKEEWRHLSDDFMCS